jgi:hypothetical protein
LIQGLTTGILPVEIKAFYSKDKCIRTFIGVLFVVKKKKNPKNPVSLYMFIYKGTNGSSVR